MQKFRWLGVYIKQPGIMTTFPFQMNYAVRMVAAPLHCILNGEFCVDPFSSLLPLRVFFILGAVMYKELINN